MTLMELSLWRELSYFNGRMNGKFEILGKLAKLNGEKRLEATEKLLRDHGTLLKVFEDKVVEEDENFLVDLGVAKKVAEEDENPLIDLGFVKKVAEEDLEKDLEKGTLLIEL
ncbi:uncharacterized protein EAE98_010569 [Botrytis deweyae]|uniref:Uncharacterized protein n=1 Tax=Botrytis deweyae TaxID=2478750 RepID=A0ABQ7I8C9_9HELO|nr:uncharacterized protein EAE98_010569 [Botrytis deweyae]KAF7916560.1 hypothetical protein EAE98_010569 [Botrytis deweyae]